MDKWKSGFIHHSTLTRHKKYNYLWLFSSSVNPLSFSRISLQKKTRFQVISCSDCMFCREAQNLKFVVCNTTNLIRSSKACSCKLRFSTSVWKNRLYNTELWYPYHNISQTKYSGARRINMSISVGIMNSHEQIPANLKGHYLIPLLNHPSPCNVMWD